MFKPTQCLEARLRLTTKQVNGGYYKGNRTGSMGKWGSRKGTYTIDWTKVRTYVSPDLHGFKLTPFVTKTMEPTRDLYMKTIMNGEREVEAPRSISGKDFLDAWRAENEEEYESLRREANKDSDQQANAQLSESLSGASEYLTNVRGESTSRDEGGSTPHKSAKAS